MVHGVRVAFVAWAPFSIWELQAMQTTRRTFRFPDWAWPIVFIGTVILAKLLLAWTGYLAVEPGNVSHAFHGHSIRHSAVVQFGRSSGIVRRPWRGIDKYLLCAGAIG